ncbi:PREDICTED: cell growth-regulating nucleolar protein [Cyphomyrmex costatus]|uniref:Cell growth-regulating nucleolar protein n=1 Tax=Cyphomyrmex costatus TaxID=456900 RepID=A0A195CUF4_9HYME|nr:PREDICTED: cell growth-regulating nucleolar protein [Cyphomyrmex costatus]XP_018394011.1 PREDICTED: cell growth-regulating nucleolar protein [Cyphomyrmex costatus]KYN04290.1 Cell growth-regulating nucleolar protein [Cyphomyrmex costatus]
MVVFTCNHCGDSLRKPKVAIHYQQICRNAPFVTCVDCLKDFRGDEYVAHTKCITEAERYGAKHYVPKPGANKGERKQQEWINIVNDLLHGTMELSNAERNFLNTLSKYENIPRKKAKFLNFVRNAIGNRVNATVVESTWSKMENAHKQSQQVVTKAPKKDPIQNQEQSKDETTHTQKDSNNSFDNQNLAENQNNENICKENNSMSHQNENDNACEITNGYLHETQNKSKKRKLELTSIQSEDQTVAKINKQSSSDNGNNVATFYWKKTILDILQIKGEIPLKKLRNKVIKKYICYVFSLNDDTFKLTEYAKAIAKFDKTMEKLRKSSAICILNNKIKLL